MFLEASALQLFAAGAADPAQFKADTSILRRIVECSDNVLDLFSRYIMFLP
ncbi:MAG: hypothetical protein KGL35_27165 [Bradyrhizobium sp.]|uniref:hypothetical protein n=1 Tax=Bradyrhizobium sp. TaxID=376 RepID=UPI00239AD44A|nr:hypothetical protein [Bradyrhizobium sp.]MDE2472312.1 hypothetical protein [Bradyrhizobium sp.]